MTDQNLRDALRRALHGEAPPGLGDRMAEHRRRVAAGEVDALGSRISWRAAAAALAVTALVAAASVLLLAGHRPSPTGGPVTPPSAAVVVPTVPGSPSPSGTAAPVT